MKTVLITGASSGIGREFARAYQKQGYRLLLCARRVERRQEFMEDKKVETVVYSYDLSEESECYKLLEAVENEDIDVFINNAGFGLAGDFLHTDLNKEIRMVKLNDIAMHILMKGMLQKMQKRGSGTILNVASSAGLFPAGPYMATYYASKAYILSLSRAVARELKEAKSPVYVCALCPGPVDTEFNQNADVIFAIKGISAEECVSECLKAMEKRKTVIIPSALMKRVAAIKKILPDPILIKYTGKQQKRKIWEK